ncbi:MAG: hypothetical protein Q7S97_00580 [Polaromonas sp.]|nr:hypothetical protein [Polaromonas sp.]
MREEFAKVLRLRFDERNRRMIERFTEEKQRFNARGIVINPGTVVAMHKVLETELKESALAVVTTAIDAIGKKNLLPSGKELQTVCLEALSKRKDEIETLYLSDVRHIEQGLPNKAMLQPYMSTGNFYLLQQEEMLINLSSAYERYIRDRGGNLTNMIKNKFHNHPLVAWAAIVTTVIIFIAAVVGAIARLRSLFG